MELSESAAVPEPIEPGAAEHLLASIYRFVQAPGVVADLVGVALSSFLAWAILNKAIDAIDHTWWASRDDGVITLSHAKNLIDFGFVGVNPSGERVEGFSSPLQFMVFAIVYLFTHCGYDKFIAAQTMCGWIALGGVSYAGLWVVSRNRVGSILGAAAIASLLSRMNRFLEWGGSGLENAFTHATYLGTIVALLYLYEKERPNLRLVPLFVMAAFARFESIAHVGPLLLLFAGLHMHRYRNASALRLMGAFAGAWLSIYLWRSWYFHDFAPNTAYAQGLHPSIALMRLLVGDAPTGVINDGLALFNQNSGILPVLVLLALPFARSTPRMRLLATLTAVVVLIVLGHALAIGAARLDPPRTTTFLAPVLAFTLVAAVLQFRSPWAVRTALPAVFLAGPLVAMTVLGSAGGLCCAAADFELLHHKIIAKKMVPRPLVSNPDLGAISFGKDVNMLDIGLLGSSVFARLPRSDMRAYYFLHILSPDLMEVHGGWLDRVRFAMDDPKFKTMYSEEDGIYVRRDVKVGADTDERRLIDELAPHPTAGPFGNAITECNADDAPDGCMWVLRTAYRFRPDFSRADKKAVHNELLRIRDPKQRELARTLFDCPDTGERLDLAVATFINALPSPERKR